MQPAFATQMREAGNGGGLSSGVYRTSTHLSELEMLLKVLLSTVPRLLTATMMATAMPVAISAYSIAVAPDSSAKKALIIGEPLLQVRMGQR